MPYFVEDLLEAIKSRSLAPISQSTFDDDKLTTMATDEMKLGLVSDIVSAREDFFLAEESASLVAGVANYGIPSRAIGTALKDLYFTPTGTTTKKPLVRVDVSRSGEFVNQTGEPQKYYLLGDEVVLLPTPATASGTITFIIPANPSDLIATSSCTKITGISSSATHTTFTVDTDLTASLAVGDYVDFLSATAPYKLWSYRKAITAITSTTIEVLNADVMNASSVVEPVANDYICPSGFSNIPQIPVAFHAVLAQMVVAQILESLGDLNKLERAERTLGGMRNAALKLIKNRVENSPQKVNTRKRLSTYFR